MTTHSTTQANIQDNGLLSQTGSRKPYRAPVLELLGDLRSITLGASPLGNQDSGGGILYERPNGSGTNLFPDPGGFNTDPLAPSLDSAPNPGGLLIP